MKLLMELFSKKTTLQVKLSCAKQASSDDLADDAAEDLHAQRIYYRCVIYGSRCALFLVAKQKMVKGGRSTPALLRACTTVRQQLSI
jgi:hypothetical protein